MTNKSENNMDDISDAAFIKELICNAVYGKVKWFDVKRGHGYVCRNDNQEDVFIHQSAIVKSNPDHPRRSVSEGEEIQFDIVKGPKGNEAANVCGADGNNVKGSEYALRFMRSRGRGRAYRGTYSERSFYRGGTRSVLQSNNMPLPPSNNDNDCAPDIQFSKEIICNGVFGKVEWFNTARGYGFVSRNDNQEYVFIHQSSIINSNSDHPRKSLEKEEEIKFDVVRGSKGNEAANVCGADGKHVKGSEAALRFIRSRGSGTGYRVTRGKERGRSQGIYDEIKNRHGNVAKEYDQSYKLFRGGGMPPFQNNDRPWSAPKYNWDNYYDYDYFSGIVRGRGGFGGRTRNTARHRGGMGRGRSRFAARSSFRVRGSYEDQGEEHHEESPKQPHHE